MTERELFETYNNYVGIKLHFNVANFIWHDGIRVQVNSSLNDRRDIDKIAWFHSQFKKKEARTDYLISALLMKPVSWIGEMMDDDYKDFHKKRIKNASALQYTFDCDLERIKDCLESNDLKIQKLLRIQTFVGTPAIFSGGLFSMGDISLETLALLDQAFDYTRFESTNPLWQETRFKIMKYKYFLNMENIPDFKNKINQLVRI